MQVKKVVIIGAGHNGLVAAAYLAKAGHEVTVIESRDQVGGAASTDAKTTKGYLFSIASYLVSMFLQVIVKDLDLKRHGYEVLPRNPSSCTPTQDTRVLLLGPDMERNKEQIRQFSEPDAEAYERYEKTLGGIGKWMSEIMTMIPPCGPWPWQWHGRDFAAFAQFVLHVLNLVILRPYLTCHLAALLLVNPVTYLKWWFKSDILIATLLTDAMIGTDKPSGFVLLHHVMGDAGGARGVWGYMRGGMGGISKALAAACKELGVKIVLNAHARKILIKRNRVVGVQAECYRPKQTYPVWDIFEADIVVSALDPSITFDKLLKYEPRIHHWRSKVLARESRGVSMKINLALSGLPNLRAMATGPDGKPGPQHQGTIHIAPSVEYIRTALQEFKEGRSSSRPILEISLPSVVDKTLAPPGGHVMNIFVQFVRFGVDKEAYWRDVILPLLREHISNIDEIIIGVQILSPRDIEKMFGMVGGNIFHGEMSWKQLWWNRPVPGLANYRVPEINGLYLCGAGTHPGGSVCGASGYNVARVILEDLRM